MRRARQTIRSALAYQLALDRAVANPYDYARQTFRVFRDGKLAAERQEGFFMPHANETGYWWQGESARLASLAAAAVLGGRVVAPDAKAAFGISPALGAFAQHQLDWTLGRNPYGICMLYGFGAANPPHADSGGEMLVGGISNGITGASASDAGRGIVFAEGPDENNWRWVEQWLPHSAWLLLAATVMAQRSS
ncbi:MAG TPA: glycoside hydrolase family 9 protein [Steroidobacteraceae bacterium]